MVDAVFPTMLGTRTRSIRRQAIYSAKWIGRLGVVVAFCGCAGTKTPMPPRVDLQSFGTVGLVEFSSNAKGQLQALASEDFLETVQALQPDVPVLELGNEDTVLRAIGRDRFDSAAIYAIGKEFNVDAVILGHLEVTNIRPRIRASQVLSQTDLKAGVAAALATRVAETAQGATVWAGTARSKETVVNVELQQGKLAFEATDPRAAYGRLIQPLVRSVTQDFRPSRGPALDLR